MLVDWLRQHGWPNCERRPRGAAGSDILGVLGWSIECKGHADPLTSLRIGLAQAINQGIDEDADPVAIVRIPRQTDPAQWWAASPWTLDGWQPRNKHRTMGRANLAAFAQHIHGRHGVIHTQPGGHLIVVGTVHEWARHARQMDPDL